MRQKQAVPTDSELKTIIRKTKYKALDGSVNAALALAKLLEYKRYKEQQKAPLQ